MAKVNLHPNNKVDEAELAASLAERKRPVLDENDVCQNLYNDNAG